MQAFLSNQYATLKLPASSGAELGLFGYQEYNALAEQYLKNKDLFANHLIKKYGGFQIKDIWDGGAVIKMQLSLFLGISTARR